MNAEDQKLLQEIRARLPWIEKIDREGRAHLHVADDIEELLADAERYLKEGPLDA